VLFSQKAEALLGQLGIPSTLVAARGLREFQEANVLEVAEFGNAGRQHLLVPAAAKAWRNLKGSAIEAGVSLFIVSSFRSFERQAEIIKRKLSAFQSVSEVLSVSAPPCFSEHHTGRAVDIGTIGCPPLEAEFEDSVAFRWLQHHAESFSFIMSYPEGNEGGYQYEPWHWYYHIDPT